MTIQFKLDEAGQPNYSVTLDNKPIVKPSKMGFELLSQPAMAKRFEVANAESRTFSESWEMQWGEQRLVDNNYNQLVVTLVEKEAPKRSLIIHF